jgi:hypothetical protein
LRAVAEINERSVAALSLGASRTLNISTCDLTGEQKK